MSTAVTIRNGVETGTNMAKRRKLDDKYPNKTIKSLENRHKTNGEKDSSRDQSMLKKNQFGDFSDGLMSKGDWKKRWDKGQTKFHKPKVNDILLKYYDTLVKNKTSLRIFVPLCGKSVDMKWLLDKGHSVVGCELIELGVQQFFREQDISYTIESIPSITTSAKIYKGVNHDIRIYVCDFFELSPSVTEGKFDCMWDRGSLAAINAFDRFRYRDVILNLLKEDGRYLLDLFEVDHAQFAGPPNSFVTEDVNKCFEDKCNVAELDRRDAMNPWSRSWGVKYFYETIYMLTFK